ncbi:MAG: MraY family glycosyltransferase [Rhodospirillales bacterium]|tara:strand:- start:944 stop:1924 length:981 start_codon:yes stop_codon:yes gene_type:complete
MNFVHVIFIFIITASISFLGTKFLLGFLRNKRIFDTPNERSSHRKPIPKGGGIVVTGAALIALFFIFNSRGDTYLPLIIGALILAVISWIDDLKDLPASLRLTTQFISVTFVLLTMSPSEPYFRGIIPNWLELVVIAFIWVWFINIFNFMDGIDGITAVETISIGMGLFLIILICGGRSEVGLSGLVLAASALGFMWWNWSPSQLFLGDVGSIPLGFIIGWLLLQILPTPLWLISVIIPLYYLSDATITLIIRCLNREKFWLPHRKHFYQLATSRGLSHAHIASTILILNVCLIGWAWLSLEFPYISIFCASLCVLLTLFYFRGVK